jgi:tetratricopeptide (TPR) repeat protein
MKPPARRTDARRSQPKAAEPPAWSIEARWAWLGLAAVSIAVCAIYGRAIGYDLLAYWDDNLYITANSDIRSLDPASVKRWFTSFYVFNYQPLAMLTYALEYRLAEGNAAIFHATSILIHLVNVLLVFVLARRVSSGNDAVSLFTAAFFGVHPMHVESVAWVAERKDVLYAAFFLLASIVYHQYLESRRTRHFVLTAVLFLLSCLSKSGAVVLPLVLLLLDYHHGRKPSPRMFVEKIPFLVISLVFGLVALRSQERALEAMAPAMSAIDHAAVVAGSLVSYLYMAVFPVHLSAFYAYPWQLASREALPAFYYLSIPLVGLIVGAVWYSRRWGRDWFFGFGFFLVTIGLVLQVVPVGGAAMADRYTYLPYVGLAFALGTAAARLARGRRRLVTGAWSLVFVIGLGVLSAIAHGRVAIWQNDGTLFSDILDRNPIGSAYINRATYYQEHYAGKVYAKDPGKKAEYLRKAIADFEAVLSSPLTAPYTFRVNYSLGTAWFDLGDFSKAIHYLDAAVDIDSTHARAYFIRGCAKGYLRDFRGALDDYERVVAMNPGDAVTWYNKGTMKHELNDHAGAVADFDRAIGIDPEYADAYFNRGAAKARLGDYQGALADFEAVVGLDPGNSAAATNRDVVRALATAPAPTPGRSMRRR